MTDTPLANTYIVHYMYVHSGDMFEKASDFAFESNESIHDLVRQWTNAKKENVPLVYTGKRGAIAIQAKDILGLHILAHGD